MCEAVLASGFNFIFVCLPESHPTLYDWIAFQASHGNVKTTQQQQRRSKTDEVWQYRYLNDVPMRAETPGVHLTFAVSINT